MPRKNQNQSRPICFSHQTGLDICSEASRCCPGLLLPSRARLPKIAPTISDGKRAIEEIALHLPQLKTVLPLHTTMASACRCRFSDKMVPHACSSDFSGFALQVLKNDRSVMVVSPNLAFIQMAGTFSFAKLIELAYEICGTYQKGTDVRPTFYDKQPLSSVSKMKTFVQNNGNLRGSAAAARALQFASDNSASPRETKGAMIFGLPFRYGGYNLGKPFLNFEIECAPAAKAICGSSYLRCDLYWPEIKLDIEYQSRQFHSGELERARDSRRAHALRAMGIQVVFLTDDDLDSISACDVIADTIRKSLGIRARRQGQLDHAKKLELRRELGLPVEPIRTYEYKPRMWLE